MAISGKIANLILTLPWPEMIGNTLQYAGKILRGYSHEGIYKVLDYESTLEILDIEGKKAEFSKRKRVRYLQDNTIVYQDCAWGDGKILQNYQTNIGKAVDRYRMGYKTIILLSLHEIKSRGSVDDFHIDWEIKNGFTNKEEFWETNISQRTKNFSVSIIFPKDRKPFRVRVEESNRRRTHELTKDNSIILPNGRMKVTWEKKSPRLYENYLVKWSW